MHFAAKNLLYTFHQSLDTQHVTVGLFKRYARSPETRTFKNYFRRPRSIFSTYIHKRPQYSLSRYITVHRRKKNPLLCNFTTHIKTTILSSLQSLRQNYPAPTGRNIVGACPKPSPLDWAKVSWPFRPQEDRTKGAEYLSPGQRPGHKVPAVILRPVGAAYNTLREPLNPPTKNKKTQNKPISKLSQIAPTSFDLKTKDYGLRTAAGKNKPIQTQLKTKALPLPIPIYREQGGGGFIAYHCNLRAPPFRTLMKQLK